MQVWNMLHAARWKCRTQKSPKIRHLGTIAQLCRAISSQLRHVSTIGKAISPPCPHNTVNFGPLAAEICWRVWGTPANFNGFRVLAVLLHGTLVAGVSQTLRLNRGRHLYSTRRTSRWALAHILVWYSIDICLIFSEQSLVVQLFPGHSDDFKNSYGDSDVVSSYRIYASRFPPWCGASSKKCLLVWHYL